MLDTVAQPWSDLYFESLTMTVSFDFCGWWEVIALRRKYVDSNGHPEHIMTLSFPSRNCRWRCPKRKWGANFCRRSFWRVIPASSRQLLSSLYLFIVVLAYQSRLHHSQIEVNMEFSLPGYPSRTWVRAPWHNVQHVDASEAGLLASLQEWSASQHWLLVVLPEFHASALTMSWGGFDVVHWYSAVKYCLTSWGRWPPPPINSH